MLLEFYKKDDRWFADVPSHTEEENEMVSGADTLLEYLSNGKNTVNINIDFLPGKHHDITFFQLKHDNNGAVYQIESDDPIINGHTAWICNVTHDVLGEHPPYFFISLL